MIGLVSDFFREEDDYLYRKGYAKGFVKGFVKGFAEGYSEERSKLRQIAVSNLITKFDFSDQKIADGMELPIEFVKSVRESLQR